jgi:uncharacterized protein YciI
MQFIIMAHDGRDEGALDRRMSVRPQHLANMETLKAQGCVVCAGGITDNGRLIGSLLVLDLDSREAVDEYLAAEPYVVNNVWEDIRVEPCNVLIANNEAYGK